MTDPIALAYLAGIIDADGALGKARRSAEAAIGECRGHG